MSTEKATPRTASVSTAERTAFKAGDKVEYKGQLAKVVQFGFLELPTNPGADAKFSEELVATLQLPAETAGGMVEYVYFVPAGEIKSLKDDPKKLRALEMEFNPLFGDPAHVAEAKEGPAPVYRKEGQSSTRGKAAKAEAAPSRTARPAVDLGDGSKAVSTAPKAEKAATKKSAKAKK